MATAKRPAPLGTLIDNLFDKREKKRAAEAVVKVIEAEAEVIEAQILERLNQEGLDKANGRKASVSVSENVVASVEDWEPLWAFIIKGKHTQLLQKRVSDPAYRELLEMGKIVPGVKPFTKKRLNLRVT